MPRIVLLLAAALLNAGVSFAQVPGKDVFSGTVKKIDIDVGTITLQPIGKGKDDITLNLFKRDLDVTANVGPKLRLDDVAAGQAVTVKLRDQLDVEAITIRLPVVAAVVLAVDAENRTLSIPGGANEATRKVAIDPPAKINVGGRLLTLEEVTPGKLLYLTTSLDGKTVLAIDKVPVFPTSALLVKGRSGLQVGSRVSGLIVEVDAANQNLLIRPPNAAPY